MKILIYTPRFYPGIGGLENITLLLAKEFKIAGNDVKVICFEQSDGTDCGVETYYSPGIVKQVTLFHWCDVFYMPNISIKGLWLMAFNPFKTWIVSHNGWYGNAGLGNKMGFNEKLKLVIAKFSKNIYVSQAVADYVDTKGVVIRNCYDNTVFRNTNQKRKDVVFVGRLVSDKGIDVLLQACSKLWKRGDDFDLSIIGDGDMSGWISEFITCNQLEKRVSLKGILKGNALSNEMNKYKVMVVPSKIKEGFGIVVLEGLACGCALICAENGGLKEAAGEFSLFFKSENVDELSEKISYSLSVSQMNDERKLAIYLANHHPMYVAAQYLKVFNKVIG